MNSSIRAIDMFCGVGGSSWGAREAGVEIVAGFDLWQPALTIYGTNFPEAQTFKGRLEDHNPTGLARKTGDIDLILASPECTSHSPAKGNGFRSDKSKNTAFEVIRYARAFRPRWIIVENVVSMRKWSRYAEFISGLESLGYNVSEQILNSADFRAPQKRRILFIICDLVQPPPIIESTARSHKSAKHIIDLNGTYRFSPLRTDNRAKATLARADRAIKAIGKNEPFLIVY